MQESKKEVAGWYTGHGLFAVSNNPITTNTALAERNRPPGIPYLYTINNNQKLNSECFRSAAAGAESGAIAF